MPNQENESQEASQCFMCIEYKPHGCLECRTHRLLSDIRTGLYDKMGTEQNRTEWEERALKSEEELSKAKEEILEQARLLGMSGSREAKLLAEKEELIKAVRLLREAIKAQIEASGTCTCGGCIKANKALSSTAEYEVKP